MLLVRHDIAEDGIGSKSLIQLHSQVPDLSGIAAILVSSSSSLSLLTIDCNLQGPSRRNAALPAHRQGRMSMSSIPTRLGPDVGIYRRPFSSASSLLRGGREVRLIDGQGNEGNTRQGSPQPATEDT